jgi:predicted nucleic acid-binding protein
MKLVIDTNEIFSFFNPKSLARSMVMRRDMELYAPAFALEELLRIKPVIMRRFSVSGDNMELVLGLLRAFITFVDERDYAYMSDRARALSPDPDDADFLALALKLNCPLWSEDRLLKNQKAVEVYSTLELAKILEWL